ncbi:MAG: heavy-metal-associated domain-containing protein [Bacteroidetes bacterium]|nr:heavy-metal-associated domain-containing protein [Bacteroidota bacterium]
MALHKATLLIEGMTCGHCQKKVLAILENTPGVVSSTVSLQEKNAFVEFKEERVSIDTILHAINETEIYTAQLTS